MTRTYERVKRGIDIAVSAAMLIDLAPLLGLVALAVRLDSPGAILYRSRRMGRDRVPFDMLKFRSMAVSNGGASITAPGDARITKTGARLRFFKIDELPQLINVLKGDMSLVGPRPEDVDIVRDHYSDEQLHVLDVRPGLTCLAQVAFFPDMTREVPDGAAPDAYYLEHQLGRKLALDLEYVRRASLLTDVTILAKTAYLVLVKSWLILKYEPPKELARTS